MFSDWPWKSGGVPSVDSLSGPVSLLWVTIASDFLTGVSYVVIAIMLLGLIGRIRLSVGPVVICLVFFVLASGASHFYDVWTMWMPDYWASATAKAVTAMASLGTAILFFKMRREIIEAVETSRLDIKRGREKTELVEQQLSDILERTTDGFFTLDRQWRVNYANPVTRDRERLRGRELVGKSIYELLPSPDLERFMKHYRAIRETGKPERFEETYEGKIYQVHAYRMRDGGIAVFHRDATDERMAQQRVEASELRYRTLIETLPQLIWTCTPDGNCDYLSQQWHEYTGVDPTELMGMQWLERVVHPEDRQRALDHWMGAIEGLHPYDIDFRILRRDGQYRWFKTRGSAVRDGRGQVIKWFGSSTDVQDQREIRQQLEDTVRVRDEFITLASHELKTPLTSLRLQTQLFQRSASKALQGDSSVYSKSKVDQLNEQTEKQVVRLVRLVEDMLDIARIRSGRLSLHRTEFDLCVLVKDCVEQMLPRFVSSGFPAPSFEVCESSVGRWDVRRVEQAVNNLLKNALRYGQKRPIVLSVRSSADHAVLSVRDQGIGIEAGAQKKIFDRYERAVDANEVSGLGLGLFITRQIAEAHGGAVTVQSEVGKGSTFDLILPKGYSQPSQESAHAM